MSCLADLGRQLGQGTASHSLQRLLAREPAANLEGREAEPEASVIGDMEDETLADHGVEQVVCAASRHADGLGDPPDWNGTRLTGQEP